MGQEKITLLPMQLGGGLFLACVGAALIAGVAVDGHFLGYSLIAGMLAGVGAIVVARRNVAERLGRPSRQQIGVFLSAIAFELAAFLLLGLHGAFAHKNMLSSWQIGLAIVALHFFIMRWSHGPLMVLLGIAILAWLSLCVMTHIPLVPMIAGDGVLKIIFGVVMAAPLLKPPVSSAIKPA